MRVKRTKSKTNSDEQVNKIVSLLSIWPQIPTKYIAEFVLEVLGVNLTRACLQEAREKALGTEPEHTELTQQKRDYLKYQVLAIAYSSGLGALTEGAIESRCRKALKEKFRSRTQDRLVKKWVREELESISVTTTEELTKLLSSAYRKIQSIVTPTDSKQVELL